MHVDLKRKIIFKILFLQVYPNKSSNIYNVLNTSYRYEENSVASLYQSFTFFKSKHVFRRLFKVVPWGTFTRILKTIHSPLKSPGKNRRASLEYRADASSTAFQMILLPAASNAIWRYFEN